MVQYIPPPINPPMAVLQKLHGLGRQGNNGVDWMRRHKDYVNAWNNRHSTVFMSNDITMNSTQPGYMQWYTLRTVAFITNPSIPYAPVGGFQDDGARIQLMVNHFYVSN